MLTSKEFGKDYAHYLTNVVRHAEEPTIPNYSVLLKKLAKTRSNAAILENVLHWTAYSQREDGTIYKDAAEMARECGISPDTVTSAARTLKAIGIERFIKRVNGTPTTHYRLNVSAFAAAIGQLLRTTGTMVLFWMEAKLPTSGSPRNTPNPENKNRMTTGQESSATPNPQNIFREKQTLDSRKIQAGNLPNPGDHFRETPKSLTLNNSHKKTHETTAWENRQPPPASVNPYPGRGAAVSSSNERQAISAALRTNVKTIDHWVSSYGQARVRDVVRAAINDIKIHSKGAWVRKALENQYQVKPAESGDYILWDETPKTQPNHYGYQRD